MRILTVAAALLVALFSVFSVHIATWSRLRGFSRAVRIVLSLTGILALLGLGVADIRGALAGAALIRIGGILPNNLFALAAVLVAVVGTAYWVVEKQFSEIEAQMLPVRAKYT